MACHILPHRRHTDQATWGWVMAPENRSDLEGLLLKEVLTPQPGSSSTGGIWRVIRDEQDLLMWSEGSWHVQPQSCRSSHVVSIPALEIDYGIRYSPPTEGSVPLGIVLTSITQSRIPRQLPGTGRGLPPQTPNHHPNGRQSYGSPRQVVFGYHLADSHEPIFLRSNDSRLPRGRSPHVFQPSSPLNGPGEPLAPYPGRLGHSFRVSQGDWRHCLCRCQGITSTFRTIGSL